MIDDKKLAEWDALANAATPGPWSQRDNDGLNLNSRGQVSWNVRTAGERGIGCGCVSDARFIAAARTAVPELCTEVRRMRATQWQPIETAPKDATDVLGYQKFRDVEKTWFSNRAGKWLYRESAGGSDGPDVWEPTHWMPLPDPPQ